MKIVTEKPIDRFLSILEKIKTVREIYVLSPFITRTAADKIKEFAKRKKSGLRIVTNLDPIQMSLSFSDPVEPLLRLLSDRTMDVKLRKCNQLHAKVYYVENRYCVFGSSNLTMGGLEHNIELNILIGYPNKDISILNDVGTFVKKVWTTLSSRATKKELKVIQSKWSDDREKYLSLFGGLRPEPALAGDCFSKLKAILRRTKWKFAEVDKILGENEEANAKNTRNKLVFLMNLGAVTSFDETEITINKDKRNELRNPVVLYDLLQEHLYKPTKLLKFIRDEKRTTYKKIEKHFKITNEESKYRTSIHWMNYLGFVKSTRADRMYIEVTKKGEALIEDKDSGV